MPNVDPLRYVRAGVTEGLSGNAAYRLYRGSINQLSEETGDRWTGVRKWTFQQMYAATRVARANIIEAVNAPKDVPGGGLSIPERPSTVAGGYLHAGVAFTREIGGSLVEPTIHLVRSDELLTPEQVEDLIREQIEESAVESHGTFANYTIEGISFTGVENLVRR